MADIESTPHAVVTGASSGIGLTCCEELLQRGWKVSGLDRTESPLAPGGPRAAPAERFRSSICDVSDSASVDRAFVEIAELGPLDALVCSAGVLRGGRLMEMSERDYDDLFDINTKGTWLCARAAYSLLRRDTPACAPRRMVFVASGAALRPKLGAGAYSASKVALINLARVLSVELASEGILVNVVAPATVDTPFTRGAAGSNYRITGNSPLGRVAETTDVTSVIRFLLGDGSRYMTGAVVAVDGGTTAAFVP